MTVLHLKDVLRTRLGCGDGERETLDLISKIAIIKVQFFPAQVKIIWANLAEQVIMGLHFDRQTRRTDDKE